MALTIVTGKTPKAVGNLKYGDGRLVVWGCRSADTLWHICRPGTWDPPFDNSGCDLVVAKSMCGEFLVTNGYCLDWLPPPPHCPACMERFK